MKRNDEPDYSQDPPVYQPDQIPPDDQRKAPGDDFEAEDRPPEGSGTRAKPRPWRMAKSLETLRLQLNAKAPNRSKVSDGGIGDPAHQSRASDHNPWVTDGPNGVVTARDFTHDPAGGCDAGLLAKSIVESRDKRVKYVIWNRQIASSSSIGGAAPWTWRKYDGKNPHNHHCHISVHPEKPHYDSSDPWKI